MSKKADFIQFLVDMMNSEQDKYSKSLELLEPIKNTLSGQESIKMLETIYKAKREFLDKIHLEAKNL